MKWNAGLGWATIIWLVLFSLHLKAAHAKSHVCEQDRKDYCSEFIPGDGKFTSCMMAQFQSLSDDCQEEITRQKEERKKLFERFYSSCGNELDSQCKGVERAEGKALRCLGDGVKRSPAGVSVTDRCKNSIEALRKRRAYLSR